MRGIYQEKKAETLKTEKLNGTSDLLASNFYLLNAPPGLE
jgi:hypothetical protein